LVVRVFDSDGALVKEPHHSVDFEARGKTEMTKCAAAAIRGMPK
jgi:hypothetical protein